MSIANFETELQFQFLKILKTIDRYHGRTAGQLAMLADLPANAVRAHLRIMQTAGWVETTIKDGKDQTDPVHIDKSRPYFPSVPWRQVYHLTEADSRIVAHNPVPPRPPEPTRWQKIAKWFDTPPGMGRT